MELLDDAAGAGRVRVQPISCCVTPHGSGACSSSAVTVANTSLQLALIQPGSNATFSFPLNLSSTYPGGSGQCSFNMTVNFAVRGH